MSEPTNPQNAKMRSPNSVFRPLEQGQNFAGFNPTPGEGTSGVMNQNPDVQSLMMFLQRMQEQGTLPQGFHMSMGGQPGGATPEQQMAQMQQWGGGGVPPQASAPPMNMAGAQPPGMDMGGMGQPGMGGMGGQPPPMPGMGSPGAATMSPMMFGMPASPFATPANALAPTAHLGPQLFGQPEPLSNAAQMRASDLGMRPGPMQRFRDGLGQMGRSLEASYEADPGRFFRMMAAVSTGKPGVAIEAAQDEAKMAEASALRREQIAARTTWEQEQNRTRLEVEREKAENKQQTNDTREIVRANLRAQNLGLTDQATTMEDLPELNNKIAKANKRKDMDKQADVVLKRALKGIKWMPRDIAEHFADDPEFGTAVTDAAEKALAVQKELSELRKVTTAWREESRKLTAANVKLANNPEWQIANTDYREAMSELRNLNSELGDVAGKDYMQVSDDIQDLVEDLWDRIAETQARMRAAAAAPPPAAGTTAAPGQQTPAATPGGVAPPPRRKGKSLRDVSF